VKPLLVGEANPYGADPYYALYPLPENASGGRLARILGLSESQYLRLFDRRNLCPMEWSAPVARAQAENIRAEGREHVVLLGAKVARAFGFDYAPFTGSKHFYLLPHPSGLCRVWNEPDAVQRARQLLAPILRGAA
jgi:hypothetical protein